MQGELSEFSIVPGSQRHAYSNIKAKVSFVFAGFRFNSLRIYELSGHYRVSFPDRPLTTGCDACAFCINLNDKYCRFCGVLQGPKYFDRTPNGKLKTHRELVYPVAIEDRRALEEMIVRAYDEACETAIEARMEREL